MRSTTDTAVGGRAILRHLEALASLSDRDREALATLPGAPVVHRAGKEIIAAGALLGEPWFVLDGWVCRQITLPDGRRQIVDFYLPGDLAGYSSRPEARASAPYLSMSDVVLAGATGVVACAQAQPGVCRGLAAALRAIENEVEVGVLAQLVRNGRMLAHERMIHLLDEMARRHERAGLGSADGFAMPLTQENLGDALGLSTVHVNRVLQQLRRQGAIRTANGRVAILDAASSEQEPPSASAEERLVSTVQS